MEKLFDAFRPVTAAEWKNQLEKDLKGASYDELLWRADDGLVVKPYYTAEDLQHKYVPAFAHTDWDICASGRGNTIEINRSFLRALQGGAQALLAELHGHDPAQLLQDVRLDYITTYVTGSPADLLGLNNYLKKNYTAATPDLVLIPAHFTNSQDLGDHLSQARIFGNEKTTFVSSDVLPFHNRFCSPAFEIALAFAQLAEYLNSGNQVSTGRVFIRCGVSADYFMQMAKLRAMHRLWLVIRKEFDLHAELRILAETSLKNKSISDRHNNLLRTTVEAMAAVAGGCTALLVHDFDILFEKPSVLAQRMAVNQQLILKEECYFSRMADVACGSYFIESLTDMVAEKALAMLKEIENQGGFFAALASGHIENTVAEQARVHLQAFTDQNELSIGVNKFHNEKERITLSTADRARLDQLGIVNPALRFELQNYIG